MTDPINLPSKSPRFGLPLLFSGQAQKEFTVNEAHALIDMLLHPVLEGQADTPPSNPQNGECWLVGGSPTGEWTGHTFEIASYQNGTWVFAKPRDGMRLLDRSTMQDIYYRGGLRRAVPPDPVEGGATVDVEARRAIDQLITALIAGGILAPR